MKLSPRLQAIADWIDRGARLADIGTDHGQLPIYCAMNGITVQTIAADIRESPLASARRNAEICGVEDKITFLLSHGLEGVAEGSVDTIVTAGMGGEMIIDILSEPEWIRSSRVALLLQPQSKIRELHQWLAENGFLTEKARLVIDSGRIYLVLYVRWDGVARMEDDPYFLHLLSGDSLRAEYASRLLARTEKQLLAFHDEDDSEEKTRLMEICAALKKASITSVNADSREV